MKKQKKRAAMVVIVLLAIVLAAIAGSGCAMHNETSWAFGSSASIESNSHKTINGRCARD